MTPVAAPADKRFRRAQVKPARRRLTMSRARIAIAVAAALAMGPYASYRAWQWARETDVLTVSQVSVAGNQRMSSGEVAALVSDAMGRAMMTLNLESLRERLLRAPWVADASIRRVLPSTLAVVIAERRPMGIGRLNDALYLVDDTGTIIDEFGPNYAELDLPVIDGLMSPTGGDTLVDATRVELAGRLLSALEHRPELAERVSQIDVSDVRDAVLVMKDDAAHVRLGDGRFAERLQTYLELAPTLRERVPEADYIDVRFDQRVYVKPRHQHPTPSDAESLVERR